MLFRSITQTFGVNSILASHIATEIKSPDSDSVRQYLNSKPKPFVKWVGGKRQLLTQYRELKLYPPYYSVTKTASFTSCTFV